LQAWLATLADKLESTLEGEEEGAANKAAQATALSRTLAN